MELGVPGLLAVIILGLGMYRVMAAITRHPDVPGSTQLIRCAFFGITAANAVEFLISAQAYSDAVLTLMTAFFVGCLFASAVLDERLAAEQATASPEHPRPLTAPATA